MGTWQTQGRVEKGVPAGGEFKTGRRDEATGVLEVLPTQAADRFARLRQDGYVQPTVLPAHVDPRSRRKRGEWWDASFMSAEYGHHKGDYPQMPDDWTPSKISGNALDGKSLTGHRRTHRMCYTGDGVRVRMPSATSIRRYQKHKGGTFDVPVSAVHNGGTVQGWVRVSKSGDQWHATGLGFPADAEVQVAEAVSAVLEARRVSTGLLEAGDLAERRKARLERAGTPLEPVRSSWIEGVGYDDTSGSMIMSTKTGRFYGYSIDKDTYRAVAGSTSPGSAYNRYVKGTARTEVSRCDQCAQFMSPNVAHDCPAAHPDRTGEVFGQNQNAKVAAESILASIAQRRRPAPPPRPPRPKPAPAPAPQPPTPAADPEPGPAPAGRAGHRVRPQPYDIDLTNHLRAAGRKPVIDATGGAGSLYGRRGWTTDVGWTLSQFTGSSYAHYAYKFDKNPDGTPDRRAVTHSNGSTGPTYFEGGDADAASDLVSQIPPAGRSERHNGSPEVGRILEGVTERPERYEFGGYIVGPDRTDERVSVTTIYVRDDAASEADVKAEIADRFGGQEPDSVTLGENPWRPGERSWRVWWS